MLESVAEGRILSCQSRVARTDIVHVVADPALAAPVAQTRPNSSMVWGDFPWSQPPPKIGRLLSIGAVARNVTQALGSIGDVVPYQRLPSGASPAQHRASLAAFLR